MRAPQAQKTLSQTQKVTETTFGVHLGPGQMVIAAVCLMLVLWLAYRIGVVILRLVAGILCLGLVAYGIWYLFIR
jgi:hypothetical protein